VQAQAAAVRPVPGLQQPVSGTGSRRAGSACP
jgi:hypothetical protein